MYMSNYHYVVGEAPQVVGGGLAGRGDVDGAVREVAGALARVELQEVVVTVHVDHPRSGGVKCVCLEGRKG